MKERLTEAKELLKEKKTLEKKYPNKQSLKFSIRQLRQHIKELEETKDKND